MGEPQTSPCGRFAFAGKTPDSIGCMTAFCRALSRDETIIGKLKGDFAFAVVDRRNQEIVAVRSLFSQTPIYFFQQKNRCSVAFSTLRLEAALGLHASVSEEGLAYYSGREFESFLSLEKTASKPTFWKNVRQLLAGSLLRISNGRAREKVWWSPSLEPLDSTAKDVFQRVERSFFESVQENLGDGTGVGVHLSGGLDSSAVAAASARFSTAPLPAFGLVLPPAYAERFPPGDRYWMETMAQQQGLEMLYVHPGERFLMSRFDHDSLAEALEHPLGYPKLYAHSAIFDAAKARGVNVLLTGVGGEAGLSHSLVTFFLWCLVSGRWAQLFRHWRQHSEVSQRTSFNMVRRFLMAPIKHCRGVEKGTAPPLKSEFLQRFSKPRGYASQHIFTPKRTILEWAHHYRIGSGRHFSMEMRHPLLNKELIEACLALEPRAFWHHGYPRAPIREITRGLLPEQVRTRLTKGVFSADFAFRFKENQDALLELVAEAGSLARQYYDLPRIRDEILELCSLRSLHEQHQGERMKAQVLRPLAAIRFLGWFERRFA